MLDPEDQEAVVASVVRVPSSFSGCSSCFGDGFVVASDVELVDAT